MYDFRLEKRLSKHKITIFSKTFLGVWPLWPPLATPMVTRAIFFLLQTNWSSRSVLRGGLSLLTRVVNFDMWLTRVVNFPFLRNIFSDSPRISHNTSVSLSRASDIHVFAKQPAFQSLPCESVKRSKLVVKVLSIEITGSS